ncbi:MAG: carbon storage regulator [Myxococcales bacterium]|jgi:carbon storage regulator CsrA|nr:carbon storage regulator [Myxococcales bacterium]
MLVVQRRVGERLVLSGGIEITVVAVGRGGVKLAVTAPKDVWIARGEVHDAVVSANAAAARTRRSSLPASNVEERSLLEESR